MEATLVNLYTEGVSVTGRVLERSAAVIEVALVEPFGRMHLQDGSYAMAIAQRYAEFEGKRGDAVIEGVLRHLYEVAVYVAEHEREVREQWWAIKSELEARSHGRVRTRKAFLSARSDLRANLRAGAVDPKDYQRGLAALRDELAEWQMSQTEAVVEMFEGRGMEISLGLQVCVIRYLDPDFEPQDEEAV